jgi:hypothetical protein
MGGHPRLSAGVNRIVGQSDSLDLEDVLIGAKIEVVLTGGRKFIFERVDENFGYRLIAIDADQSFLRRLREKTQLDIPLEGRLVEIAGGCSVNPHAEFGYSMVRLGRIDMNRSLLWRIDDGSRTVTIVSPKRVVSWKLID